MTPKLRDYRHIIFDIRRWRGYQHRPGDIIVATPPKCGTTWMQTIVASLLFPDGNFPAPVMQLAPWIDARFLGPIDDVLAGLEAQTHRRAMKTHTPADGVPWFPTASYIVVGRDGRDAFMSFVNHMANIRPDVVGALVMSAIEEGIELPEEMPPPPEDVHAFYDWWLREGPLFEFFATWWQRRDEPNVLFAHYDDMKADLDGEMRRVAAFLDIPIDESTWPAQVERCTFESMKAQADRIGPFEEHFVGGADAFLYKGSNGRWRNVLTSEELAAFDARAAETLPADARAWLAGRSAVA
jgi:aryl sulfotransferase